MARLLEHYQNATERHDSRRARAVRRRRPVGLIVRRIAPVTIVSLCVAALLVWYVIYTQGVVRELTREASRLA
jgi:hypothetical protein